MLLLQVFRRGHLPDSIFQLLQLGLDLVDSRLEPSLEERLIVVPGQAAALFPGLGVDGGDAGVGSDDRPQEIGHLVIDPIPHAPSLPVLADVLDDLLPLLVGDHLGETASGNPLRHPPRAGLGVPPYLVRCPVGVTHDEFPGLDEDGHLVAQLLHRPRPADDPRLPVRLLVGPGHEPRPVQVDLDSLAEFALAEPGSDVDPLLGDRRFPAQGLPELGGARCRAITPLIGHALGDPVLEGNTARLRYLLPSPYTSLSLIGLGETEWGTRAG